MYRSWKGREIGDRELAHVLPSNADHICNIREADQVWSGLNKLCCGDSLFDVGERTGYSGKCIVSFARKFKREAPWLADTDQSIVTTSFSQSLYQRIRIGVVTGQLIVEFEREFHRYSCLLLQHANHSLQHV